MMILTMRDDLSYGGPANIASSRYFSVTRSKMMANTSAAVISSQTDLFSFAPQQSLPPAEWITVDPGYWKHKVTAPKKTP